MKEGPSYYFYHTDHLGTPQKLTSTNGAVAWSFKYLSFGEATVDAASSVTNNLRFAGQYFDTETGLHYNWHRYYDPKTGRYFRPDPKNSFDNGAPSRVHPFVYGENNPIRFIDALGLEASESEECNCEKELDDCVTHALKMEVLCTAVVGIATGICYVGCTAACVTLSGPAMPACIAACAVSCTVFGEAGLTACLTILTAELAYCAYKYNKCKL